MSRSSGHRPAEDHPATSSGPGRRRFGLHRGRREAAVVAISDRVRLLVSGPVATAGSASTETGVRDGPQWDWDEAELERYEKPGHSPSRSGRVRLRFAPTRSAGVAVGTVALLVAAISFWWVLSDRPRSLAIGSGFGSTMVVSSPHPSAAATSSESTKAEFSASGSSTASSATASLQTRGAASPSNGTGIQVDVVGKVAHPGVVALPAGSRVVDAITAAGGALPGVDLNSLNLARRVTDGEQVAVGVAGASDAVPPSSGDSGTSRAGAAGAGGSGAGSSRVNLNSATAAELDALPGVGPVLANNIVGWREAHGRFTSIDQLQDVSGIGAAKFASLKNAVTV